MLSGDPPSSTKVGEIYTYTPDATDPDGDPLIFTIENTPEWASFDEDTGTLSGEPQAEHLGSYPDITITVSDGEATDSLTFDIEVTQVALGSVTLSWEPPTMNNDGSTLTDLSGFKVYYGKERENYTEEILLENPGLTTFVLENLSPATYYFVVTALNSVGEESDHSGIAEITLD